MDLVTAGALWWEPSCSFTQCCTATASGLQHRDCRPDRGGSGLLPLASLWIR